MQASDVDKEGWNITTVASQVDSDGVVRTLVCADDGEWFWSYVHHHDDLERDGELLYEIQGWLTSLWLSPMHRLFAVDDDGLLHSNESGGWQTTDLGAEDGLTFVWGLDDAVIFTCGAEGMVLEHHAGMWRPLGSTLRDSQLYALHGLARDDLHLVGERGRAWHFDGGGWRQLQLPTNVDLHAVVARGPDEVYICGAAGTLLAGAGDRWQPLGDVTFDLYDLTWYAGQLHVAAGEHGLLALDGDDLVAVRDDIDIAGLASAGNFLSAVGGATVYRFDGQNWTSHTFAF